MKTKPILFSGEMVRAILDGRKTQTRRIVKPQPKHMLIEAIAGVTVRMDASEDGGVWYDADCINPGRKVMCPHGVPGDQLWVRETFFDTNAAIGTLVFGAPPRYIYRADFDYREKDRSIIGAHHWKPSIFCTRSASRITLEITAVRVERLNTISEEDAKAEGCARQFWPTERLQLGKTINYRAGYAELWERINGAGSWALNPWVWVLEFRRVTP